LQGHALYVSQLKVYNFRNLADQTVELQNGPVYITGLNGNGKTNLVEALYVLSGSRSFRTSSQSELLKWGKRESSVFGTIARKDGTDEIGIAFTPGQRTAFKNGNQLSSVSDLVGLCGVVAFSPSDLSLVKGAPAGRRRFLDRHMVDLQPSFLGTLVAYQRAVASKAALLKNSNVDLSQVEAWNEILTEHGGKIVENRLNFVKSLEDKARVFQSEFAQTDGELRLTLESDFVSKTGDVSREAIAQGLHKIAEREIAMRSTLFGPHRDDVSICLGNAGREDGVDARAFASQGQTRSIVLALTLGVIELMEDKLGEAPIVVLDDVDSELDAPRAKRLFAALGRRERQLIITGTALPPPELEQGVHAAVQLVRISEGLVLSN
jgi:DNA replication and repair protein RecF